MRLLYLTPGCFDKGGISRYSRYQIAALRKICGEENVRVLSLLAPDPDDFEDAFDVHWHGKSGRHQLTKTDRAAFVFRTLTLAASWGPAIVHSAHVNFAPVLTMAGRIARAKTVLNVYGLEIWSGLNRSRRLHMSRSSAIISDCHFTARYVRDEKLHRAAPAVIWDPVDLDRFSPGPVDQGLLSKYGLPDPSRYFVVMSLGRLAKAAAHKGFDRLILVAAELAAEMPELRIVIAGKGDDRTRLEALAEQHGVRDRIRFAGGVAEADLAAFYRCAHLFSLVSDRGVGRGEGIPLTPLEAMASGVPVIVGNEDGSQEALMGGQNGFVISPRDRQAHGHVLRLVRSDPAQRHTMAAAARRIAEEHFGYDAFVAKHQRHIADMLGALRR